MAEPTIRGMFQILSNFRQPATKPRWPSIHERRLPAPKSLVTRMARQKHPLASFAALSPEKAVGKLRKTWGSLKHPALKRLATLILDVPFLGLSIYTSIEGVPKPGGKRPRTKSEYWLKFRHPGYEKFPSESSLNFSLPAPKIKIPAALRKAFPISKFRGLEEFLTYFGGLRLLEVDSAGHFLIPHEWYLVSSKDSRYEFGKIGDWEGSLPFFEVASGNMIILKPNGQVGFWCHEHGSDDAEESPTWPLEYTFSELLEHFVAYMQLPPNSPESKQSPFH